MKELTHLEKRDAIFNKIFDENNNPKRFDFNTFFAPGFIRNATENFGISEQEYRCIVNQLIEGGYLSLFSREGFSDVIFPTILGHELKVIGGFVKNNEIQIAQQVITDGRIETGAKYDKLLVCGTWFAGIAAALLLAWNMFEFFYERCHR